MSRVKLSEFKAKTLLFSSLNDVYTGISINFESPKWQEQLNDLANDKKYVTKVDQGVKKRNKMGLVKVGLSKDKIIPELETYKDKGYQFALVEPMVQHEQSNEKYLAFTQTNEGVEILFNDQGGVDIESNTDTLQKSLIKDANNLQPLNGIDVQTLRAFYECFQNNHMSYLEINPLVSLNKQIVPLDAAVLVDSVAEFGVKGAWNTSDIRSAVVPSPSEKIVKDIQATSMASLTLRQLQTNGGIFLVLSGGGASVVIADEFATKGLAKQLANYGEYSGNPNSDETYRYMQAVVMLIKASNAPKKVLVIAGGVANFTDIAKTFAGVIKALSEEAEYLRKNVTVFVRRGGPNQKKGLAAMESFLADEKIAHAVHGPEQTLGKFVDEVAKEYAK